MAVDDVTFYDGDCDSKPIRRLGDYPKNPFRFHQIYIWGFFLSLFELFQPCRISRCKFEPNAPLIGTLAAGGTVRPAISPGAWPLSPEDRPTYRTRPSALRSATPTSTSSTPAPGPTGSSWSVPRFAAEIRRRCASLSGSPLSEPETQPVSRSIERSSTATTTTDSTRATAMITATAKMRTTTMTTTTPCGTCRLPSWTRPGRNGPRVKLRSARPPTSGWCWKAARATEASPSINSSFPPADVPVRKDLITCRGKVHFLKWFGFN